MRLHRINSVFFYNSFKTPFLIESTYITHVDGGCPFEKRCKNENPLENFKRWWTLEVNNSEMLRKRRKECEGF